MPAQTAVVCVAPLPTLDASSSLSLEVSTWAGRPARLARMDRLSAIVIVAADAALGAAGLSPEAADWPQERSGVILGTAYGCYATNRAYDEGQRAGTPSPRLFAYTLPSSAAGELSIHARLLGPVSTCVGGLTAGLDALREAARHLDAGRAERMLVVGADVVAPVLTKMRPAGLVDATHDVACALVLDRSSNVIGISRFVAGDPSSAAKACLEHVGGTALELDGRYLAAAPLVALREAFARGLRDVTIVATDPVGQATAVRLTPR